MNDAAGVREYLMDLQERICAQLESIDGSAAFLRDELARAGGGVSRPGVLEAAQASARSADVCLVVGTSAQVWPPVALALHARDCGAYLIDVNPEVTSLSREAHAHLVGPSGTVLPALWERAGK